MEGGGGGGVYTFYIHANPPFKKTKKDILK